MLPDLLTPLQWGILAVTAIIMGMDKGGLRGINIISIPIYALVFQGKLSVSIVLLLFIVGDICAMFIYHNKISWKHVFRLMPPAVAGLITAIFIGNFIPDKAFKVLLALIIIICLILMMVKEIRKQEMSLPDNNGIHNLFGLLGGFTSTVGNAAGPIMSFYLLSVKLPKEIFIGTGTVFFFILNLLKLPGHIWVWHTLNTEALKIDIWLAPFVIAGVFLGRAVVTRIPERPFRLFIMASAFLAALALFL